MFDNYTKITVYRLYINGYNKTKHNNNLLFECKLIKLLFCPNSRLDAESCTIFD